MGKTVGIEKLAVYPCSLSLSMETLAKARGADPKHPLEELMVTSRSINPVWEDPVTMAANAALDVLEGEDPDDIALLICGTESSLDYGKPMSTYVQRHAGISNNCRNFEAKHACYGGSAGLMMAAHWVASGYNRGRKALVITSDQSRTHLGKPWEYVLGAGSVAMIISDTPNVLEFELEHNGFWTQEIHDTYRPTSRREVGHADTSLFGYLEGLEGSLAHYCEQVGEFDYEERFKKHIYHVPFGGMTMRGHKAALRQLYRGKRKFTAREAREHWEARTAIGLQYNSQLGGTYTSATFVALAGLIDACDDLEAGDRISMYTYGSGSCAEFYGAKIGDKAKQTIAGAKIQDKLDARQELTIAEYEAVESARAEVIDQPTFKVDKSGLNDLYKRVYEGSGRVVLDNVDEFERHYRRA